MTAADVDDARRDFGDTHLGRLITTRQVNSQSLSGVDVLEVLKWTPSAGPMLVIF